MRRKLGLIVEHATWLDWAYSEFGKDTPTFKNRESIWKLILTHLAKKNPYSVLEFGVFSGYATDWFLSRASAQLIQSWCGFDTFSGLPVQWREHNIGDFSTEGVVPDIKDGRLTWVTGLVEETFSSRQIPNESKFILLDLDLFDPTLHVLRTVTPSLEPGDIIYFDEAFDRGEFDLVKTLVNQFNVECIGLTHVACALKIISRKPLRSDFVWR
jgi:hypothetical protein